MRNRNAIIFVVVCLSATAAANAQQPPLPNIVLILADDLGFSDLHCYGGEILTPHLDALAAGGTRYTQFYNCTRCCPSRASLLTGLYPHQAGVGDMTGDQNQPGYRGFLQPTCVTFAEVLKTAGYRTAMVGKWHVGDNISPIDRGFDNFYGWTRGYGVNSWYEKTMVRLPVGAPQRMYQPGQFFATDALTDHALDFLADMRQAKSPWLLYVAYQAPHFPLHARDQEVLEYQDRYRVGWDKIRQERLARQKQLRIFSPDTKLTPLSPIPLPAAAARNGSATDDGNNPPWDVIPKERQRDLAARMAVYAAMITGMDRNIGRLVADLQMNGELNNTLIIFLSDNGACAEWEPFGFDLSPLDANQVQPGVGINLGTQAAPSLLRDPAQMKSMWHAEGMISYGSAWANASTTPWRMYKHSCHEGGISGPMIVHWPARIKGVNFFRRQAGHLIDIMPTFVEVSGAQYPLEINGQRIDPLEGKSLLASFDDKPIEREFLAWEHEGNAALRAGDWKIVRRGGSPWELYNIAADRTELTNFAEQDTERVKRMAALWQTWAERTHVFPKPAPGPAKAKQSK
jgi:arylsulfatase A-like enzyme